MDNLIDRLPENSDGHGSEPGRRPELAPAELAGARRRWQALDQVLRAVRVELMPPRMMLTALSALQRAADSNGALLINTLNSDPLRAMLHQVGQERPAIVPFAWQALQDDAPGAVHVRAATGEQLIVCRISTRFAGCPGLALWRDASAAAWDNDDLALLGVATSVIRIVLEHEAMQNEMAVQARTDPLTGLPNRRAFLDEARRRIERTHRENLSATLLCSVK